MNPIVESEISFGAAPPDLETTMALADLARQTSPPLAEESAEPFPTDLLPSELSAFVNESARAIGCPTDFIGVPLLVLAGSAIGMSRVLQIKPEWQEAPRLFAAIVGDPGGKKSPALKLVSAPYHERQGILASEYDKRKKSFEEEKTLYDVKFLAWKESAKQALKDEGFAEPQPPIPESPLMSRILAEDSTTEALAILLKNNVRGIAVIRDEISGWVRGMDQYRSGKGADRQFYLSAWSGSPITVDRKGKHEPINIQRPFLSVVGGLPPDILSELVDRQGREDGFIHRVLFCMPEHTPMRWSDDYPSEKSLLAWRNVLASLWALNLSHDEYGQPLPVVLSMTDDGKTWWKKLISHHYEEQNEASFPDHLKGPWAKLDGYSARLALIINELRFVSGEIHSEQVDAESIKRSFAIVDYFKSHARRVHKRLRTSDEDKKIQLAVKWISKQPGESCSGRNVLRNNVAGVTKMDHVLKLFREMMERGYGRFIDTGSEDGPTSWTFVLSDSPTTRHISRED